MGRSRRGRDSCAHPCLPACINAPGASAESLRIDWRVVERAVVADNNKQPHFTQTLSVTMPIIREEFF